MNSRLNLVCITLFLSLFYSPLTAVLYRATGGAIGPGIAELSLILLALSWLIELFMNGRVFLPQKSSLDVLMLGWLIAGGIALARTYELHENIATSVIALRYLFIIPVSYFIFRVHVRNIAGVGKVLLPYMIFLKIAVIYTLLEFILVNFFGMRLKLEHFFLLSESSSRLYDSIFSAFLKPAGPIHGSQNASFLGLIALFSFGNLYKLKPTFSNLFWTTLAALTFGLSFTISAGIAAGILIFCYGIPTFRKIPKVYVRIIAFLGVIGAFTFRKTILAFRDKGMTQVKSVYYEKTQSIASTSINRFLEGISSHPLGTGWPNHLAPTESPAFQPFLTSPPEIFIFKLGYYLGPFFLVFFVGIQIFVWIRLARLYRTHHSDLWLPFIGIVVLSLITSMIHYETFTRIGFSLLYAFCLAALAAYNEGETSINPMH